MSLNLDKSGLPIVVGRADADEDNPATEHFDLVEAVKVLTEKVRALSEEVRALSEKAPTP